MDADDSGLDDLRNRLRGPVRHENASIKELLDMYLTKMHELERLHHALSSRLDSAFIGADVNRHHAEHEDFYERRVNSVKMRRSIFANVATALIVTAIGVIAYVLAILPMLTK